MKIDAIDKKILTILQKDASLNIGDIAEMVGLSHTPCWRRIHRLEETGIISRRVCIVDSEMIGMDVSIFVFVRLNMHTADALEAFEQATLEIPEVLQCYTMSGEFDYLLRVVVPAVRNYEKTVKGRLLQLPNVGMMNSHFALSEIKNTTALPILPQQ